MLRAFAALMVVYTHSISQMGIFAVGWQQRTPARTSLGTFGVDLFFVISGFIIYHSAAGLQGRGASLSFLWHRFRRINPAFYAATLLTVMTWLPSLLRHRRHPVSGADILSWLILLPFSTATVSPLVQAWSLSFEWYFYLLFFLLIFFRLRKKWTALCLLLVSLALAGWLLRYDLEGLWTFYLDPLPLEFLLGAGIGVAYRRWAPGRAIAHCLLWPGILLGLTLILTGYGDVMAVVPSTPIKYLHAICWGSAAALVVAGCVFLEKKDPPFLSASHGLPRLLLLLGDASYSIYLVHMLILGLLAAFYLRVGFFLDADLAIPIHAVIAVAGSLLFYKGVELPLLRRLGKSAPGRPTPVPPAAPSGSR